MERLVHWILAVCVSQRISAKDALDAEYFWTDPLLCDPKRYDHPTEIVCLKGALLLGIYSLRKYESSHEFQTEKKRQHEENAKRQKLQHPPPHSRLPPAQQSGQAHVQIVPGPNQLMHNSSQPPVAAGPPGHHYGKPLGPSGGLERYPPSGGYNQPNHGSCGQGCDGGYDSGPYQPQGCDPPPPYGSSGIQVAGPWGGSGFGFGPPNYPQGGGYGGSRAAGRGLNMMGSNNHDQQYGWRR